MDAVESLFKIASISIPVRTTSNVGKKDGIAKPFVNKSDIASVSVIFVSHATALTHSFPAPCYGYQCSKYY